MSEITYTKGKRRKDNQVRNRTTPPTQFTSSDVEKRIDDRIAWCKKSYGEDKMNKLIDMTDHRNRKKALDRIRSQHSVLRSYIKQLSGEYIFVYFRELTDTSGTILVATASENPNEPAIVYCKIDIQSNGINVSSTSLPLTAENIRYIKRVVYLSALGQIS